MFPGESPKSAIRGLVLAALLTVAFPALPAYAGESGAPSLWQILIDALEQLIEGEEDPEGGLSVEPGG